MYANSIQPFHPPKLLLVPATILKSQVRANLPINSLGKLDVLSNIINPEDITFYQYVNKHISDFIPKEVIDTFSKENPLIVDTDTYKIGEIEIDKLLPNFSDKLKLLLTQDTKNIVLGESLDRNNYVGHYFEIDRTTVGVMLTLSDNFVKDTYDTYRSLLKLLANTYFGDVDGVADIRNDIHLSRIVQVPLFKTFVRNVCFYK